MYDRPSTIILELRKANSDAERETTIENVMRECSDASMIFIAGARMVLDDSLMFDITNIPLAYHDNGGTLREDWDKIKNLIDVISNKGLIETTADYHISTIGNCVDDVEWNMFYSKILKNDLECGIDAKTWNAAAMRVNTRFII